MQQLSMFMNQIMPLLSLYSEIIACLVAASVLSLIVGWMLHKSKARKQLNATTEYWEKRYRGLEDISRTDAENLEGRLQSLGNDAKVLQADNRMLTDSLKANDSSIQKFRSESIELNRQHAESQERLQRIIQRKDREILALATRVNKTGTRTTKTTSISRDSFSTPADQAETQGDGDLTYVDTVAISCTDLFDATVQMSTHELIAQRGKPHSDEELESTVAINGTEAIDMEEATVALDEDVLAFARRSSLPNRRD